MPSLLLPHLKCVTLAGFLCLILSLPFSSLSAQNRPTTVLTDSVDYTNNIAVAKDSNLTILDINNPEEMRTIPLSTAQNRLQAIDVTRSVYVTDGVVYVANQLAYLVFASQPSFETTPQLSQIVQVDLKTGQETSIYERNGITQIILSPDGEKGLVAYYGDKIQRGVPTDICLLIIKTGICQDLNLKTEIEHLNWVDSQFFTAIYAQDKWETRIFDVNTLESESLSLPDDWFLYSVKTILSTRTLLMTAISRSGNGTPQFLIYNLDTQALSDLGYDVLKDHTTLGDFSPDNQYLMYGSFNRIIVEFQTGKLIAELTNVSNAVWLSDGTGIIASISPDGQPQLIRLDITTGKTQVLENGKSVGFLLNKS